MSPPKVKRPKAMQPTIKGNACLLMDLHLKGSASVAFTSSYSRPASSLYYK